MAGTEQTRAEFSQDMVAEQSSGGLEFPIKAKLKLSGPNAARLYEMMLQKPFQMELEICAGDEGNHTVLHCTVEPAKTKQVVDLKDYLLKGYSLGLKKKPDKDGWVHISLLGHMLGALNPRGSVKAFGYKRLQDLVAASKLFELSMLGPNMACRPIADGASVAAPLNSGQARGINPVEEVAKLPSEIVRGTIVALKKEFGLAKCENLAEEIYFKAENLRGELMDQLRNGAKVEIEFVRENGRIKLLSVASVKTV
ncbi:MAG: OST-HTH/LOTUS domain-containing protein [Verrucomicrobiales bacterium]